jgi:hypothetical protein
MSPRSLYGPRSGCLNRRAVVSSGSWKRRSKQPLKRPSNRAPASRDGPSRRPLSTANRNGASRRPLEMTPRNDSLRRPFEIAPRDGPSKGSDAPSDGRLGGPSDISFGQFLGRSLDGPSATVASTAVSRGSLDGHSAASTASATSPGQALGRSLRRALAPLSFSRNGQGTPKGPVSGKEPFGRALERALQVTLPLALSAWPRALRRDCGKI